MKNTKSGIEYLMFATLFITCTKDYIVVYVSSMIFDI